ARPQAAAYPHRQPGATVEGPGRGRLRHRHHPPDPAAAVSGRPFAAACLAWGLAVGAVTAAVAGGDSQQGPEYSGGATTVFADGRTAFSFPAANLSDEERTRFVIGNSFFRRNWVQAPAST